MDSAITRAQIANYPSLPETFVVSGYSTHGDLGTGAVYTSKGATSGSPMAIQNSAGTWYKLLPGDGGSFKAGWLGVFANAGTNQSTAMQAAINLCSTTLIPRLVFDAGTYICTGLTLPPEIMLIGAGSSAGHGYQWASPSDLRTVFQLQAAGGEIIASASGGCSSAAIVGIDFVGNGATSTTDRAIHYDANTYWATIKCCAFYNFSNEGIYIQGVACILEDLLLGNCVMNTTQATPTGCIILGGSDNYLSRIEAEIGTVGGSLFSSSMLKNGFFIGGANHFITQCVGEFSDSGFYLGTSCVNLVNCRADHNYGHGFFGVASQGSMVGCLALSNSLAGNNLYDGFNTNSGQSGNFVNCFAYVLPADGLNSSAYAHRYGFNDPGSFSPVANRNEFNECRSIGHVTGVFNANSTYPQSFTVGSSLLGGTGATPNIAGTTAYKSSDSSPVTITNFLGGIPTQDLFVFGNSNVTIQNNGTTIVTSSGTNIVCSSVAPLYFKLYNGIWYQVGAQTTSAAQQAFSANSSTSSSTTLTAADIFGGAEEKTLSMTGAITVASNATLPLVTALVTAMGSPAVGQTYKLRIMNSGGSASGVWTIVTNTGWTLNGTILIGVGTWREFYVTLTSLTAATLQDIGAGSLV